MAQATFYTFSKRGNSTAVPTGAGTAVDVVLKDGTSLIDPVFLLQLSTVPAWSMMQFEGRYYKITNITSVKNDLWEIAATVDVLATYKTNIQAASAFVAYDTSANTEITDRRLSIVTNTVRAEQAGDAGDMLGRGFSVIVNTVGENACASYVLTLADAMQLLDTLGQTMENLFPDPDPDEEWLEQISSAITYGFRQLVGSGNAADCIKSAFIIPIPYSYISGTVETIMLGVYNTGVRGKKRTSRGIQTSMSVSIPWQASDWRRNAPYHEIYLYIPYIGVISYPASALIGASGFNILIAIDETAGDAIFTVSLAAASGAIANTVIGQYNTNLASNFAIGASNITPKQLATSVLAGGGVVAASVMTGGVAAVAAGTAGIAGEFNSVSPIPSSVGGAGGGAILALWGYAPRCLVIYHNTTVSPDSVSAIIGTPTNAVKSLAGLSGYVETRNFSVSGAMTDRERQEINRLMDGGVYIE